LMLFSVLSSPSNSKLYKLHNNAIENNMHIIEVTKELSKQRLLWIDDVTDVILMTYKR
jgi:hypothetical protein